MGHGTTTMKGGSPASTLSDEDSKPSYVSAAAGNRRSPPNDTGHTGDADAPPDPKNNNKPVNVTNDDGIDDVADDNTNAAVKNNNKEQDKTDNSDVFAGKEPEPENEEKRVPKSLIGQGIEKRCRKGIHFMVQYPKAATDTAVPEMPGTCTS